MVRPKKMSPLQERHYDRNCATSHDQCQALKEAAADAIAQAKKKMDAMLDDTLLFPQAYSSPNPAVTGTNTTWLGHCSDLKGRIRNIWAMLNLGITLRCEMELEIASAMALYTPATPRRYP